MASDNFSGIGEAIRKASEAYAEALSAVGKALQGLASGAGGGDRDRLVENWLRVARMSKDGVITALEQGFELWEREIRRTVAAQRAALVLSPPIQWTRGRKTGGAPPRLLPAAAAPWERKRASRPKLFKRPCRTD